jgi:hypothetical protein
MAAGCRQGIERSLVEVWLTREDQAPNKEGVGRFGLDLVPDVAVIEDNDERWLPSLQYLV